MILNSTPNIETAYRGLFLVRITGLNTPTSGPLSNRPVYNYVEQTFGADTGAQIDADPPRIGTYVSATQFDGCLIDPNNRVFGVGDYVWVRMKGAVTGQTVYETVASTSSPLSPPAATQSCSGPMAGRTNGECFTVSIQKGTGNCAGYVPSQGPITLVWDGSLTPDPGWTNATTPIITGLGSGPIVAYRNPNGSLPPILLKQVVDSTDYPIHYDYCSGGTLFYKDGNQFCTETLPDGTDTCADNTFVVTLGCTVCPEAPVTTPCCPSVPNSLCCTFSYSTGVPSFSTPASYAGTQPDFRVNGYTAIYTLLTTEQTGGLYAGNGWSIVVPLIETPNPVVGCNTYTFAVIVFWCQDDVWKVSSNYYGYNYAGGIGGTCTPYGRTGGFNNGLSIVVNDCDPFSAVITIAAPYGTTTAGPLTINIGPIPTDGGCTGTSGGGGGGSPPPPPAGGCCDGILGVGGPVDGAPMYTYGNRLVGGPTVQPTSGTWNGTLAATYAYMGVPGTTDWYYVFFSCTSATPTASAYLNRGPSNPYDPSSSPGIDPPDYSVTGTTENCGDGCATMRFTDSSLLTALGYDDADPLDLTSSGSGTCSGSPPPPPVPPPCGCGTTLADRTPVTGSVSSSSPGGGDLYCYTMTTTAVSSFKITQNDGDGSNIPTLKLQSSCDGSTDQNVSAFGPGTSNCGNLSSRPMGTVLYFKVVGAGSTVSYTIEMFEGSTTCT